MTAKPAGSIPADYLREGELFFGRSSAEQLVARGGGTPLFVYDMKVVRDRTGDFRAHMPAEVQLHYALKANPYRPLLQRMAPLVDGMDVASRGEMERAIEAGVPAAHISMAGPGKGDDELRAAIEAGITINLESEGETDRAFAIADMLGIRPNLAVRVNPDFEIKGSGMRMGGGAKPFGVDAERVPALVRRIIDAGARWQGFHIFAGSQALDASAIVAAQASTVALAADLAELIGARPPLVNLGGGFGIPYFPGDKLLDVAAVGEGLAQTLSDRPAILAESSFAIELGRWLVGECGIYLTRILDRKVSHGETFLIVDGGLHLQLAASGNFGTVVRRNYPIAIVDPSGPPEEEIVTVVGRLCTPLDKLGDKVLLPASRTGDLVALFMAGAYGASASPRDFLGHPPAHEMLIDSEYDPAD